MNAQRGAEETCWVWRDSVCEIFKTIKITNLDNSYTADRGTFELFDVKFNVEHKQNLTLED